MDSNRNQDHHAGLNGQGRPAHVNGRNWPRILAVIIAVIILVASIDLAHVRYDRENTREGRHYKYAFSLRVNDTQSTYRLIVPLAVVMNGSSLPTIGFDHLDGNPMDVSRHEEIQTDHGLGLLIEATGGLLITLEGSYEAWTMVDHQSYDGTPVLSMSSLNHTSAFSTQGNATAWAYSSVDGLEFEVSFSSLGLEWMESPHYTGHVRGGLGYHQTVHGSTLAGWAEYPVEVRETCVD